MGREYSYLSGPREKLEQVLEIDAPFQVDKQADWGTLDDEATRLYDKIRIDAGTFPDDTDDVPPFSESSSGLLSGAGNLLNFLVAKEQRGEKIDTIVVLDKSARNALYIFTTLYRELESVAQAENRMDLLPQMPKIKFINVGKNESAKHADEKAMETLSHTYPKTDLEGRVLIVDEVMSSGTSVKKAGEALLDAGYEPTSLEGISNYDFFPGWYRRDDVKGIADVGDISADVRRFASRISEGDGVHITNAIREIGWQRFKELCVASNLRTRFEKMTFRREGAVMQGIRCVNKYIERFGPIDVDQLCRYFASAGGFLALAPDPELKETTREYRQVLKFMVNESLKRGYLHFVV